jgi:mannose-1-phosphate guanylyltransferase
VRHVDPTPEFATWPVLLAGGDGTRLHDLTRLASGQVVPKQFCSFVGSTSLLRLGLERARRIAPSERTLAVLAAAHRRWWLPQLAELPAANRLVQPLNRGTAPAVLLAARAALARDPRAVVLLVPTDHFVADEDRFASAIARAVEHAHADRQRLVLVGIETDLVEPAFGWIVPAEGAARGVHRVLRFVEKPDAATVRELRARGALVNTLLVAAAAAALVELFARHLPALAAALPETNGDGGGGLARAYAQLDCSDFSRDLLEPATARLLVVPARRCGWNDLGTPDRVVACLQRRPPSAASTAAPQYAVAPIELARAVQRRPSM